ncbi:MAG: serine acetyltransferase [Candidatus Acidiferrum sp.]
MSDEKLDRLAREFHAALDARIAGQSSSEFRLPSKDAIAAISRLYLESIFPIYFKPSNTASVTLDESLGVYLKEFESLLIEQLSCAIRFDYGCKSSSAPANLAATAEKILVALRGQFSDLARLLSTDLQAALDNDPSVSGLEEILLSFPGLEAVTIQRLAHRLYQLEVPFLPRMFTEAAHSRTGIDIHPGASIGESFFIDHGTGVVVGETSVIGNHVTLYHGVTLGAFNPTSRRDPEGVLVRGISNKRHPDLEDHVTVYPGATILGGSTRIGHHSIIGGNVWLTHSVAPYSRVTLKDPELLIRNSATSLSEADDLFFLGSSI